jgi:hypothetical protein
LNTTQASTNIAIANKAVTIVQQISVAERSENGTGNYAVDVIYLLFKYVYILLGWFYIREGNLFEFNYFIFELYGK